MRSFADRIRTRIIPAILTALGITFLAAGLLSFTNPVAAVPAGTDPAPSPSLATVTPTPASAQPTVSPTPVPLITLPPIGSAVPSTPAPTGGDGVASRVRIAGLKIDLPIIKETGTYPPCNVAMYYKDPRFPQLAQPGQGESTYLFAHARTGMFLPMLTASKVSNGKKMVGMLVEVWTSDDQRYLYVITDVYRHQAFDKVFDKPLAATTETLWLQTSEGVGTQPKLLIKAEPLSNETAPHDEANPKAKPVDCS